jgi:hypothetical protein
VHRRAKIIDEQRIETKVDNLVYWDKYREMKFDLIKDYIDNMKIRKRVLEYVAMIINLNVAHKLSKKLKIKLR